MCEHFTFLGFGVTGFDGLDVLEDVLFENAALLAGAGDLVEVEPVVDGHLAYSGRGEHFVDLELLLEVLGGRWGRMAGRGEADGSRFGALERVHDDFGLTGWDSYKNVLDKMDYYVLKLEKFKQETFDRY